MSVLGADMGPTRTWIDLGWSVDTLEWSIATLEVGSLRASMRPIGRSQRTAGTQRPTSRSPAPRLGPRPPRTPADTLVTYVTHRESFVPGRRTARVGDRRWFGGPLVGPRREDEVQAPRMLRKQSLQ